MAELVASGTGRAELTPAHRQIAFWLLGVAALVFLMVMIGGITRLTDSGLSMVEWRPVTGWLPPLSEHAWTAEFEKYRQFPEYQKINAGMSLAEFKAIYWPEYLHRLLGRLIGLAFAVPFLVFLLQGKIERRLVPRLAGIFLLGAAQGALGWFMVQSGLVDHPDVSHYRLTAHLGLAVAILLLILWTALGLLEPRPKAGPRSRLAPFAALLLALGFVQLLSGGLVAGLNAGLAYNTWPLMNGEFMPSGLGVMQPWWLNPLENATTVQFQHRIGAYILAAGVALLWWRAGAAPDPRLREGRHWLLAALLLQFTLGVFTLLLQVPVTLGALHQAGAVLLLGTLVWFLHLAQASRKAAS